MRRDTGETGSSVRNQSAPNRRTCRDNPTIAEHLEAIRVLCGEYGVLRLEAFGSVCMPELDPERSNVDFLVEYPEDYDYGPWASRLTSLQEALANLLGREVDLILTRAIRKKYFLLSINETRELLFAA
jgi:uncharacterized protein